MANVAYPTTLPIDHRESRRTLRDGREEDTVGDGVVRVRKMHADRYDFDVKHPALTSSEMTTLQNLYNNNPSAIFDFVWPEDGVTYTVRWGKQAIRTQWLTATRRHAWVRLVAA